MYWVSWALQLKNRLPLYMGKLVSDAIRGYGTKIYTKSIDFTLRVDGNQSVTLPNPVGLNLPTTNMNLQ